MARELSILHARTQRDSLQLSVKIYVNTEQIKYFT